MGDDVDVRRYTILELHARNDDNDKMCYDNASYKLTYLLRAVNRTRTDSDTQQRVTYELALVWI